MVSAPALANPVMPRPRMRAVLVVFTLLIALAWRIMGLTTTEIWADEAMTLMIVRASWWDLLVHLPFAMDHPPLAFLPFKAWSLVSDNEAWMRLLPVLQGVGAVAVLMLVAWRIDPRAAVPTGLLAALSPVAIHYSEEVRGYSQLFMLSAFSLWSAQQVHRRPVSHAWVAALSVVAALAAHTHVVGIFVYPMCIVFLLVLDGRSGLIAARRPGAVWLWVLLVSPLVWFCVHWSGVHQTEWAIPPASLHAVKQGTKAFLGLAIVEAWEECRAPRPMWTRYALERVLIFVPAALAIAGLLDRRLRRVLVALACAGGVYLALMLLAELIAVPNLAMRTLLPAWAPVAVLLGVGVAAGVERFGRVLVGVPLGMMVLLLAVAWLWLISWGPPRRTPTRDAYAWVRHQIGPCDPVVTTPPWMQDLTAYYLGDLVASDRLLGDTLPLYEGSPPVRRMAWAGRDADWPGRLRAALSRLARESGGDYSVWHVQYGVAAGPEPGNVADLLTESHRVVDAWQREARRAVAVVRYVPVSATRPGG